MNYRRASIAAILCSLSMIGAILAMGVMADRAMATPASRKEANS